MDIPTNITAPQECVKKYLRNKKNRTDQLIRTEKHDKCPRSIPKKISSLELACKFYQMPENTLIPSAV